jgi:peptidoglycan/LPS O-acetylase OafA/YrhL
MQRLTRLDGLRGVLAVYVMLGHAMPVTDLPAWASAPFAHGEAAVDLFFALSGLVIISSLGHYSCRFWPFMWARARRLLPVYFVVLAGAIAIGGIALPALPWLSPAARLMLGAGLPQDPVWHILAHLTLTQGLIPQGLLPFCYITLLGPAWSLSTEWQFYVLIALVLPNLPGGNRLFSFAMGILAVGVLYRLLAPHLPPAWQFSRAFLPDAAPYFALGLAAALWLRGGGCGLLMLCAGVTAGLGFASPVQGRAVIPLLWLLALLVQTQPRFPLLGAILDSRLAQYLGAVSYPLYLLNEPVQRALILLFGRFSVGNAALFTWTWLPLALAMPVLIAILLHHGLEKPLMRITADRRGPESQARLGPLADSSRNPAL